MKRETQCRWIARWLIWQLVVGLMVGWNVQVFSEAWTNWTLVSFACQAVILTGMWKEIRSWEEPLTCGISFLMGKLQR